MRDIGKNIRDLRSKANLTQEELAEKLFVTRQTVSNYENGKSRPDVDMIVRIGEILNADANTVIYGIPAEMDKRQKYRRVAVCTFLFVVTGIFMAWIYPITKQYRNQTYLSLPFYLVVDIGLPSFWIMAGWWLMEVMSLVVVFRAWNQRLVGYVRTGALAVLAGAVLILLINLSFYATGDYLSLTADSFSFSFPYIPLLSDLSRCVVLCTYRYPVFYAVFGIVFRLFGFPKPTRQ